MTPAGHLDEVRRSLQLGAEEESLLRQAAPALEPEIRGWVDAFYVRLLTDPAAMALLADEGRVLRLKRSLQSWFHELFALPLDAAYERARAEIGRVHMRIGMPAHLMVTTMSHLKADMRRSALQRLAADPERAERVARAAEKHLDLELCLMLNTYARRIRQADRQRDRQLLLERMARRLAGGARDALDAAACYAELMRRSEREEDRSRWAARLEHLLRRVARSDARSLATLASLDDVPVRIPLSVLVHDVLEDLAPALRSRVQSVIRPPDLSAIVLPGPLRHALGEVLMNALHHDLTGRVTLALYEDAAPGVVVDVTDSGPGWPPGLSSVSHVLAATRGMGLAYAELVASLHGGQLSLFAAPGRGAGVRFLLAAAEAP